MITCRRVLWAGMLLAVAATCLRPPWPYELALQHVATACGLILLLGLDRRFHLSTPAFAGLMAFLFLHVFGARWLYSYVPYDRWCLELGGFAPGRLLGWQRNHYDRMVHFLFGLLMVLPVGEMLNRCGVAGRWRRALLILAVVLATSLVYELAEWIIALVLAPDYAESFNGQQGDRWDPAKDMALAMIGCAVGIGGLWARSLRRAGLC